MAYPRRIPEWIVYDVVANGLIIYVGCTEHFTARQARHRSARRFPEDVDYLVARRCKAKRPARIFEARRIAAFNPPLNALHRTDAARLAQVNDMLAAMDRAAMQFGSDDTARRVLGKLRKR
jgi:hypothetical protein